MAKLKHIRHDYLRYANVWEDAAVLVEGLQPRPGERHLSIASGGDNAFMMLTTDPSLVVAVDVNLPQLHLCRLKQSAIKAFDRTQYLEFVGFRACANRRELFEVLAHQLPPDTLEFWRDQLELLDRGLIQSGKFERYFRIFAHWILPFIHTKRDVRDLLAAKSETAQAAYYHQHWNTWRWRLLFKLFFSKTVMGWAGRDPAFFDEVKVDVGPHIFQKAENCLSSLRAQNNHILTFNLSGHFGETLPDYVQPQHYDRIKANIERLHFHHGLAESAMAEWGKFDCFNLSNIFEYMDAPTFKAVAEQMMSGANPGARFAYWNLMVPRNMADLFPGTVSYSPDLSAELEQKDRGFFYNKFIVNTYTP